MPRSAIVGIVACTYAVVMAGTTLPSPLYPALQSVFSLSTASATQLFAVYAGTVIVGLVLFGSLSDRYSRRSVLWVGVGAAIGSGLLYSSAATAPALYIARSLSGVSAALVTGTATAFLADAGRSPRSGTGIASLSNAIGLGVGPLLAATVALLFPGFPLAPFAVHTAMCAACGLALVFVHHGTPRLRARHGWIVLPYVPSPARAGFGVAVCSSFGFAVMGAVTAISAISLTTEFHVGNVLAIGAIGSLGFLATAAGQGIGRLVREGWLMIGYGLLIGGTALLITAAGGLSGVAGAVAGLTVAGLGHGVLFSRGLQQGLRRVPEHFRARASAAYWCIAYALTALGAVLVGAAGSLWGISLGVEAVYGAMIGVALITLAAAIRINRHR